MTRRHVVADKAGARGGGDKKRGRCVRKTAGGGEHDDEPFLVDSAPRRYKGLSLSGPCSHAAGELTAVASSGGCAGGRSLCGTSCETGGAGPSEGKTLVRHVDTPMGCEGGGGRNRRNNLDLFRSRCWFSMPHSCFPHLSLGM